MALSRPSLIVIEGNISSGKSTLLKELESAAKNWNCIGNVDFWPEPLQTWCEFGKDKTNLLDLMYKDPTKYASDFQMVALMSKIDQLKFVKPVNIVERSIDAQKKVFIPLLYEQGHLTKLQREVLEYSFQTIEKTPQMQIDLMIYLNVKPEIALKRLEQRKRQGEEVVDITYLNSLDTKYNRWLINSICDLEYPVWEINANEPISASILLNRIIEYFQK